MASSITLLDCVSTLEITEIRFPLLAWKKSPKLRMRILDLLSSGKQKATQVPKEVAFLAPEPTAPPGR